MIWINRPKQNCRQLANWWEAILFRLGMLKGVEDGISKIKLREITNVY